MAEVQGSDVSRDIVVDVLTRSGMVDCTASPTGGALLRVTIARSACEPEASNLAVFFLGDPVDRDMIRKLSRDYGIPIHLFWNPSMIKKVGP
jgi:hypothetical protein